MSSQSQSPTNSKARCENIADFGNSRVNFVSRSSTAASSAQTSFHAQPTNNSCVDCGLQTWNEKVFATCRETDAL